MTSTSRSQIVINNKGKFCLRFAGSTIFEGERLVCKINKPRNFFWISQVEKLNHKE